MSDIPLAATSRASESRRTQQRWHLVTNHLNMLYILAAGMVMSPAGFRGKHYADMLTPFPGLIPLFRDKQALMAGVLAQVTNESRHLRPCIASFDLTELSGPVRVLKDNGRMRETTAPLKRKAKNDISLLVRAPLPLNMLSSIAFLSDEDRASFEGAAASVSNVDLSEYRVSVTPELFVEDDAAVWPTASNQRTLITSSGDQSPAFGQAMGGALAMLYQTANLGELGLAAYRRMTGDATPADMALLNGDPVLAGLDCWIEGQAVLGDDRAQLFWGSIQALVDARSLASPAQGVDVVLDYLEGQFDSLRGDPLSARLDMLLQDMRACFSLSGATATELFERHKGPLSRSLLLFCLRERCKDLLEFSHPLLTESDYVSAGILFGVRDTWLALPNALRPAVLARHAMFRMSHAQQLLQAAGVTLLSQPPRPVPLRELFSSPESAWSAEQGQMALILARRHQWNDCIRSRITWPDGGQPPAPTKEHGAWIVYGEARVQTWVLQDLFLEKLKRLRPVPHDVGWSSQALVTGTTNACG